MTTFHGSCLCGQLRFEYDSPSLWCGHCHCSLCQRAHGAPLVTWVGVAADSQRGFCTACGSTVFFRSRRWPGEIHIVRSNINGAIDAAPEGHVHWESRASWFDFEDSLPRSGS